MHVPQWWQRLWKSRVEPLRIGDITETSNQLNDLMTKLREFDKHLHTEGLRLQRYIDTHPSEGGNDHAS